MKFLLVVFDIWRHTVVISNIQLYTPYLLNCFKVSLGLFCVIVCFGVGVVFPSDVAALEGNLLSAHLTHRLIEIVSCNRTMIPITKLNPK